MPQQPQGQAPQPSRFAVFDDFSGGMNTQASRIGLNEKEAAWMENLQPIAANNLLGVQAPAAAATTLAGETVVRQFFGEIGTQAYIVVFCASGAAYACAVTGGPGILATITTVTKFANAGTFSATGGDATSWNGERLLFTDSVAGYSSWDGSVFVASGGVSPNFQVTNGGTGYTSGATAAITGGSGSGATASVQTSGGVVIGLTLTSAGTGYKAADVLTVTISPVGAGSGALVNGHAWPFITPLPTTLAVAFGRVWLGVNRTLVVTGVGSSTFGEGYDDFSPSTGSLTTTLSDTDLVKSITALRFLEGYLYILGDNSVKFIGSISVSGSSTTFTITPLSSDQGTTFLSSVVSYNRLVIFVNTVGVYAVFGASVEKISDAMDGIFRLTDFTQPVQCAVNEINNIHTLLVLVKYKDPVLGSRALMLAFAGKRWYVISQGSGLASIVTITLNGHSDTFGSSGADVTQLLQSTSTALAYKLMTALTAQGNPIRAKRIVRGGVAYTSPAVSDLMLTLDSEDGAANTNLAPGSAPLNFIGAGGVPIVFLGADGAVLQFVGGGFILQHSAEASQTGRYIGATLTGTTNGVSFQGVFLEHQDGPPWRNVQ